MVKAQEEEGPPPKFAFSGGASERLYTTLGRETLYEASSCGAVREGERGKDLREFACVWGVDVSHSRGAIAYQRGDQHG